MKIFLPLHSEVTFNLSEMFLEEKNLPGCRQIRIRFDFGIARTLSGPGDKLRFP